MKSVAIRTRFLCGFIAGVVMGLSATAALAEDATPDLTGSWAGKVEAGVTQGTQKHEPHVPDLTVSKHDITFTLTIERQDGRALIGTWSSPDHSEKAFGVLRRDNQTLILVDEDSHFSGVLLSPGSMELCLWETHDEAQGVWCLLMEKQSP